MGLKYTCDRCSLVHSLTKNFDGMPQVAIALMSPRAHTFTDAVGRVQASSYQLMLPIQHWCEACCIEAFGEEHVRRHTYMESAHEHGLFDQLIAAIADEIENRNAT